MSHNDASREGSGSRVDPSRSSTHDPAPALTPSVSRPVDLQAWERLARGVIEARQYLAEVLAGHTGGSLSVAIAESSVRLALHDLALYGTPERILGLIDAVQQGAEGADPHCPECHSSWFRTLGDTVGKPYAEWLRECKVCGHEYKVREALMLRQVGIGEPDPTPAPAAPSPESSDHA